MSKTYEEYLEKVRCDGWLLKIVPKEMQTDEIIDAAMEESALSFIFIKDESKKTDERCLRAVNGFGHREFLIDDLPEEFRNNILNGIVL